VDDGSDPPIENSFRQIAKIHHTNDTRPWTCCTGPEVFSGDVAERQMAGGETAYFLDN
jgi:hypothetical protein